MPRQRAVKQQTKFFRGLITEASPLEYPDSFFDDGDNIELTPKQVSRRLGLNAEPTFQYSDTITKANIVQDAISEHIWKSPGGDSALEFYILRIGTTLYFYDNTQSPRSAFKKAFTVDLDSFLAPGQTTSRALPIATSDGFKRLFVAGNGLEPFYITFSTTTGTITTTEVDLQVRDIEDIVDGLAIDEEPTSYSSTHEYNMRNRGWVAPSTGGTDPWASYFSAQSRYPGKNKQWWVAKNTSDVFDSDLLDKFFTGTTSAPKGHYILNAFAKDREAASGISGLPTEITTERPSAVAFFGGRVFWGMGNKVFFSRTIQADGDIGQCYQEYDPTSEDISDLLATDGGELPILGASNIIAMSQLGAFLVIYADNGLWTISGADGIFRATEYSLGKLSDIGISSAESIVEAEGTQFFWGLDGVYAVAADQVSQAPKPTNLTFSTINTFYNNISEFAKESVKGVYDRYNKRVRWIYTEQTEDVDNTLTDYTKLLTYDLRLQAWIPSTFPKLGAGTYPAVIGVSTLGSLTAFTSSDNVEAGGDQVQAGGDDVVILTDSEQSDSFVGVKFLVLAEDGTNVKYTFCELNDSTFYDFKFIDDTGVSYSSYIEPGDEILGDISTYKQAPYITIYANRTETLFVDNGDGSYSFDRPSSILMTAYWDWSDSNGRVTPSQQVYRFPRNYVIDTGDLTFNQGSAIIVTKNKLRGKGRTLRLRLESEAGKDFQIHGWSMIIESNVSV